MGAYSTDAHPFGLVYDYLDGLDLKQYLRNEPNVGRLKLVLTPFPLICYPTPLSPPLSTAGGDSSRIGSHARPGDRPWKRSNSTPSLRPTLNQSDPMSQANILVDKDGNTRIAGLGNPTTFPHSPALTTGGRVSTDRLSRNRAPEMTRPGASQNLTDPTYPTKAGDMYAFGVLAWEVGAGSFVHCCLFTRSRQVLTGRPPFSEMTEIAATYSMLSGARPPRPDGCKISDRVWDMIERCWHDAPSRRLSVGEVVSLLGTELGRTSDFCLPSSA